MFINIQSLIFIWNICKNNEDVSMSSSAEYYVVFRYRYMYPKVINCDKLCLMYLTKVSQSSVQIPMLASFCYAT